MAVLIKSLTGARGLTSETKNNVGIFMNKAAQLSEKLEQVDVVERIKIIEEWSVESLFFDVIDDAMCIMHDDGSVNIIEHMGKGDMTVEVISSEIILRVLQHYRPFKEVFKRNIQ